MRSDEQRPTVAGTLRFPVPLHRALKLKAVELDESVSELVNEAVRQSLAEDAADLEVFEVREAEPEYPFEEFVRVLKQSGRL